ncbi:response regulator [Chitinispirillales bacterium ANBcel5]|uniref:response regulator n=1 Tax=Cellulosispirillum alkaliphilum TaxID=3039283 RepID=UPI002A570BF5|nr:response regulator [Chitinispirillales bacterium ANBcel5]
MAGSILILDDVEIGLTVMKMFLKKSGYSNIVTFDDPHTALSYIKDTEVPSLIITDYKMPKMTGLDFLNLVSSLKPDIEAIIVTGDAKAVSGKCGKYTVVEKGCVDFFKNILALVTSKMSKPKKTQTTFDSQKIKIGSMIS